MPSRRDDGFVLIAVLLTIVLLSAVGSALVLTTTTETRIAANFRDANEALDAAEAIVEVSLADIVAAPDWNQLIGGATRSAFVDGPPTGARSLADGSTIDLAVVASMANCEKPLPCTTADMDAATEDRPWGTNNPRWTLFAYGRLADILPGTTDSPFYVVLMAGDDPAENDGDPAIDGADATNPGRGVLALRAEAFGPGNAHKAVELTMARDAGAPRILTWHDAR
jgi:PilX N-terminal